MRWTNDDLFEALQRYEQACIDAGMRPKAIHSYWDYAGRFLRWRNRGLFAARRGPARSASKRRVSDDCEPSRRCQGVCTRRRGRGTAVSRRSTPTWDTSCSSSDGSTANLYRVAAW